MFQQVFFSFLLKVFRILSGIVLLTTGFTISAQAITRGFVKEPVVVDTATYAKNFRVALLDKPYNLKAGGRVALVTLHWEEGCRARVAGRDLKDEVLLEIRLPKGAEGNEYEAPQQIVVGDKDCKHGKDYFSADVAVGDFDRDGYYDIAVLNGATETVTFLFNDGAGHFGLAHRQDLNVKLFAEPREGIYIPHLIESANFDGKSRLEKGDFAILYVYQGIDGKNGWSKFSHNGSDVAGYTDPNQFPFGSSKLNDCYLGTVGTHFAVGAFQQESDKPGPRFFKRISTYQSKADPLRVRGFPFKWNSPYYTWGGKATDRGPLLSACRSDGKIQISNHSLPFDYPKERYQLFAYPDMFKTGGGDLLFFPTRLYDRGGEAGAMTVFDPLTAKAEFSASAYPPARLTSPTALYVDYNEATPHTIRDPASGSEISTRNVLADDEGFAGPRSLLFSLRDGRRGTIATPVTADFDLDGKSDMAFLILGTTATSSTADMVVLYGSESDKPTSGVAAGALPKTIYRPWSENHLVTRVGNFNGDVMSPVIPLPYLDIGVLGDNRVYIFNNLGDLQTLPLIFGDISPSEAFPGEQVTLFGDFRIGAPPGVEILQIKMDNGKDLIVFNRNPDITLSGGKATITLPDDMPPGDYTVTVLNGRMSVTKPGTFRVLSAAAPPKLDAITPDFLAYKDRFSITGRKFRPGTPSVIEQIWLDDGKGGVISLQNSKDFDVIDDKTITATLPIPNFSSYPFDLGKYSLRLLSRDGKLSNTLPITVQLQDPLIATVDAKVKAGGKMQITGEFFYGEPDEVNMVRLDGPSSYSEWYFNFGGFSYDASNRHIITLYPSRTTPAGRYKIFAQGKSGKRSNTLEFDITP